MRSLQKILTSRCSAEGVRPPSETTHAGPLSAVVAVEFMIDRRRWASVPIYTRVGKELPVTATEVTVKSIGRHGKPSAKSYRHVVNQSRCVMADVVMPRICSGKSCGPCPNAAKPAEN
jgi:hypothetical protein